MIENLDADLKNFIDEHITSFLAWDILVFFQKNESGSNGVGELSRKLGRRLEDVEIALSELVKSSVLEKKKTFYECTKCDETRKMIDRFVWALDDREKRLLIFSEVLKKR